jgi:hypothetical protein
MDATKTFRVSPNVFKKLFRNAVHPCLKSYSFNLKGS